MLFLCEGWPLCLRDQVVVHLAPIDPSLLQPGDFYLQVTPFCDQSARIVVCSLLKEEGLAVEVVEETPVPETSYPCIFSSGWLDEINQDRQGSLLRQCLVATERGVVRLPWERVAVPDFVQLARCAGSSMASAAPSNSPLTPPPPPPLPDSSKTSSSHNAFFPLSSSKKSEQLNPVTASQNSGLASSPAAFSVETRICPAKHGIAVSLCLVDARTSSLSHLVKIKGSEAEHKPIGWVSPHTWDSRFTGTNQNATAKTEKPSLSGGNIIDFKVGNKGAVASENILEDKQRDSKAQRMSRHEPAAVATGDYIDILQAKMLFDKDWSLTEEQQSMQMHTKAQKHPNWQNQPITQPFSTQSEVNSQTKAQDVSGDVGPQSVCDHSLKEHPSSDSLDSPQCIRTVRFAEKPCTPCLARRQGGKVTMAQELRCRYRDSYQAAIQNPVTFGAENNRGNMPAVVEEDTDTSQSADKLRAKDSWRGVQDTRCHPGSCNQSPAQLGGDICKESGEINCVPCRKPKEINVTPYNDGRVQSVKSSGNFHSTSTTNPASEMRTQTANVLSATDDLRYPDNFNEQHRSKFSSAETSEIHMPFNHLESHQTRTSLTIMAPNFKSTPAPQNRRDTHPHRRCSCLSTAVVDTSEKCELIIVEGQNVRRKETSEPCAEIPQLHVVKCKNSTAFRLVSPKISRKKNPLPGKELILLSSSQFETFLAHYF